MIIVSILDDHKVLVNSLSELIMLTNYGEFNAARRALHNGALGYVLKNSEPEET